MLEASIQTALIALILWVIIEFINEVFPP